MSILTNAIDSIALGIEDYNSSDPKRIVSCTRNLFAGILLLFKHKLAELSPPGSDEALIKQRVLPVNSGSAGVIWVGKGKKTVDVQQIRERFQSLNISVDWDRVEKINKYRNEIEHYHSPLSHSSVRAIIADSFLLIRDFVRVHLGEDPLDLLGSDTWDVLTGAAEVYDAEKKECISHMESIDWGYTSLTDALIDFRCNECGSGLIDVENNSSERLSATFSCRSCGENWDFEKFAELSINEYFGAENYLSVTDGGDPATIYCPECGLNSYVLEENVCVVCEESAERECQRCYMAIPAEEIDGSGFCSRCSHMMSKDD
jgi:predicted RNA-binding Zn-ribbon protein involved in translation (DUF1610 family)